MIERYTLPEMGEIWTDTYKLKTWLQVEIAVCEAQAELGYIPQEAVDEIKAKANFDPQRVLEIEAGRLFCLFRIGCSLLSPLEQGSAASHAMVSMVARG